MSSSVLSWRFLGGFPPDVQTLSVDCSLLSALHCSASQTHTSLPKTSALPPQPRELAMLSLALLLALWPGYLSMKKTGATIGLTLFVSLFSGTTFLYFLMSSVHIFSSVFKLFHKEEYVWPWLLHLCQSRIIHLI